MVEDVDPLPGDCQKHPFPLLLPHHIQLVDDIFDGDHHPVALALLAEVAKVLPVARDIQSIIARPEGTSSGKGLHLTLYLELSPNKGSK